MRLGIAIPNRVDPASGRYAPLADTCREIESLGYDGLWMFDAISRGTSCQPDPLIALSVAATVTGLGVGTSILQVPLRDPVALAGQLMTAQVATGGRLIVGAGAGSTPGDYAAVQRSFERRFETLESSLEIMRRLWNGEVVGDAHLSVFPGYEGGPPLLIGAWRSRKWISLAAEKYDGWVSSFRYGGWDAFENGMKLFRDRGGQRAIAANIRIDLRKGENAPPGTYTPNEAGPILRRIADLGFEEAVIRAVTGDREELEAIRSLI